MSPSTQNRCSPHTSHLPVSSRGPPRSQVRKPKPIQRPFVLRQTMTKKRCLLNGLTGMSYIIYLNISYMSFYILLLASLASSSPSITADMPLGEEAVRLCCEARYLQQSCPAELPQFHRLISFFLNHLLNEIIVITAITIN